jgi:hypothetical protein
VSVVQKACDRCTQGVMDVDNPHLHGLCSCPCHGAWSPLPHDGPVVNGYLTREINASEHDDMVKGGRCRTSFTCATPEDSATHHSCRGHYIARDWSRQPCRCPCHAKAES